MTLPSRLFGRDIRGVSAAMRALLLAACAGLAASCGGGVDSGGTGAPVSSYASGPITGFGSVIVNGVRFDDRSATVRDGDGNARSRDDLRLGMSTDVRGNAILTDGTGISTSTATSIVFSSEIVGRVSSNDLAARRLVVLAQGIDIATTTVFDDALVGGQAAIAVGDTVEVYGHVDAATGRYAATRVERKANAAAYVLRGIVANLDAVAKTFSIGAARISYVGLAATAVPATLANGQFVRAVLALAPGAGGTLVALRLGDGTPSVDNREEAKVRGLVSAFTSSTSFSVNGTPVDARNAQFPRGSAGLALGVRVEVEGATTGGVLVATRVTLLIDGGGGGGDDELDVSGLITLLDSVGRSFVVRGVTVSYSGTVDFRNGTAVDLAVGREVEARGTLSPDGTRLQATRIDIHR